MYIRQYTGCAKGVGWIQQIKVFTSLRTFMSDSQYRERFWKYLLTELTELDPWYSQFKLGKQKVSGLKTRIPGIGLWFRLRSSYLEATVTIENTGIDRIENFWNQLLLEKSYINSMLDVIPDWQPGSPNTAGRISTKIYHRGWDKDNWWSEIIKPIKQIMDGYRDIILPSINALYDLETTYFYAIQITNSEGKEIDWMGGISYSPEHRLKQHISNFSKNPASSDWKLTLIESISFETEGDARLFESNMLATEIRAPNRKDLSSELFRTNPISWAKKTGRIN